MQSIYNGAKCTPFSNKDSPALIATGRFVAILGCAPTRAAEALMTAIAPFSGASVGALLSAQTTQTAGGMPVQQDGALHDINIQQKATICNS